MGTPTTTAFTAAASGCSGSGTDIPYEVYGDVTAFNANAGSAVQTAVPVNGINYGDTIRVGDEFRRVEHDAGSYGAPIQSLPTASITIAGGVAGTKTGVQPTTTQASSGLTVDIVVKDDDELTSITVTAAGSGYEVGQELTFAAVTGTPAYNEFKYTLTAGDFGANTGKIFRLSSGFAVPETRDTVLGFNPISPLGNLKVAALTGTLPSVTNGAAGSGATTGVSPSGGSGTGLVASVVVKADNSAVESITVTSGGSGYHVGDVLSFAAVQTGGTAKYDAFTYTLVEGDFVARRAVPAPIFKQNGMMYDITFESGCRTHADCRNNGIDENASDGPDPTPLVEGNDMGAVCHPGGACICSSNSYFGDGCTTDGRGTHAAPKKYVSGNINNLECDKSGLTPSIPLRATATVSRTNPRKVVLTATAEHDDNLPQSLSDIATATALTLAGDDADDYDYVVNDDQLNGFDVIFTKKATALSGGLSKTIEDSTASDNTFTTVTGYGGGHVDNDIVKITNLANGVKVGDMIRIEGQVRRVTYVSPLCKRGEIDNTDAASKAKSLCPGLVASSDHYLMVEED